MASGHSHCTHDALFPIAKIAARVARGFPVGRCRHRTGPTGTRRRHRGRRHDGTGARRTAGPRAGRCRDRQDRLARSAIDTQAAMAHLLEEPRGLRPAYRVDVDIARRHQRRCHRVALATQDSHRQSGELRLRRHCAAAGSIDHHASFQAVAAVGWYRNQTQGELAGLQARMHSRRRQLHTHPTDAQLGWQRGFRQGLAVAAGGPHAGDAGAGGCGRKTDPACRQRIARSLARQEP